MVVLVIVADAVTIAHAHGFGAIVHARPALAGKIALGAILGAGIAKWTGGAAISADVMRFGRSSRALFASTAAEFLVGNFGFNLLGLILGLGLRSSDLGAALGLVGLTWLATVAFLVQGITVETNELYAASLASSNALGLSRRTSNIAVGVIGVIIGYIGLSHGATTSFLTFINYVSYALPAIPGIILADYFVVSRMRYRTALADLAAVNWRAVIAYLAAVALSLVTGLGLGDPVWRILPLFGFVIYLVMSIPQVAAAWRAPLATAAAGSADDLATAQPRIARDLRAGRMRTRMRFGLGVPTGTEGMMYPVPYADPDDAVRLALAAEELGFDSVWGNDHVSTQAYVRAEFPSPPRFYDPYLYLTYVAAQTSTLGLATAVTVMSFRHPVVVAKQAATLDQLSHGRFILGLGIGAYREEAEAMWPDRPIHRGRHADEFFRAIGLLLGQRRASFDGEFIAFRDVESFPKPAQPSLPLLSGGNAPGSRERAAKYATGWLPAVLSPAEIGSGLADIRRIAERAGRELPPGFDVAPQFSVALGRNREDALARFERTQLHAHMRSLSGSTLRDQQGGWTDRNLIGSAPDILERVEAYAEAGVTTLSGLLFACNTVEETLDAMADFAENVIAPYRKHERKVTPSARLPGPQTAARRAQAPPPICPATGSPGSATAWPPPRSMPWCSSRPPTCSTPADTAA